MKSVRQSHARNTWHRPAVANVGCGIVHGEAKGTFSASMPAPARCGVAWVPKVRNIASLRTAHAPKTPSIAQYENAWVSKMPRWVSCPF